MAINNSLTLPTVIDGLTPVTGSVVNRLRDAILALEGQINTTNANVSTLEKNLSNPPIISLAGDLGGTLSNPLVIRIQNHPISSVAPNLGDTLTWNGLAWTPNPNSGSIVFSGDLSGTTGTQKVIGLGGRTFTQTAPTTGQFIAWDGYTWKPTYGVASIYLTQSDWYVDWTNGNDSNPGTLAQPVKTVMGGVVAKWGTNAPTLAQNTTIHVLTSQPVGAEEIVLRPILTSLTSIFRIQGTPTLNRGFALGVVTAKNRANKQGLTSAGFTGCTIGQMVVNTTIGKASRAMIISIAGDIATLSQPLAVLVPGTDTTYMPAPAEVDTWAQGDTVSIYDLPALNLLDVAVSGALDDAAFLNAALWIDELKVPDASATPGSCLFFPRYDGGAVILQNLWVDCYFQTSKDSSATSVIGCWIAGGGGCLYTQFIGGATGGFGVQLDLINWLDGDHIVMTNAWATGLLYYGYVNVPTGAQLGLHPGSSAEIRQLNYANGFVYGGGTLSLQANTTVVRRSPTASWVACLNLGSFTLPNGGTVGSAEVTNGQRVDGIALTPANLDVYHNLQDFSAGARFCEDLAAPNALVAGSVPPSIIFKPGVVSSGLTVATWAEVQTFVANRQGACIVYVDDSLAAAHVPAASGITDFFGRGEIRGKDRTFPTLIIDNGATLKGLYRIADTVFLMGDTTGAVPAFDWDYASGSSAFFIDDGAFFGNQPTATHPCISVPATKQLWIYPTGAGGIYMQANVTFITTVAGAPGGEAVIWSQGGALESAFGNFGLPATWAGGAGSSTVLYDSVSASLAGAKPLAGSAASNTIRQIDSHVMEMTFNANATNILAPLFDLTANGTLAITIEGFGGSGGGGGGQGGGSSLGAGGGASGGCIYSRASFVHDLTHPLNIDVGAGGAAGVAGVAGGASQGGAGGNGGDGYVSRAWDGTTLTTLASLAGSAGGGGGGAGVGGGPGNGGGPLPGTYVSAGMSATFPGYGGEGGGGTVAGSNGHIGAVSLALASPTGFWSGGLGGTSTAGQGGGGGGGGMGPFASGASGGNSSAGAGGVGTASTANKGNGAGGGAGGTGAADAGGHGGAGAAGWVKLTFIAP